MTPTDDFMRTRIVFLLDQLNLAGAQKRAVNIARSLDSNRFEVEFICLMAGGPLESEVKAAGIHLTILAFDPNPKKIFNNLRQIRRLMQIFRERAPAIVQAYFYWSSIYGSIASWLTSVPILISSRTSLYDIRPQGRVYRFIERITNPLATSMVAISQAVKDDTIEIEGVPPAKVEMVYNGVEPGTTSIVADGVELRRSLGVASKDSVVVIVANFHVYKRHDTLLRAARVVLLERPDTKFLLVGRDGGQLNQLKQLARELAIDRSICWAGVRTDIPDILSISDIGVLCSETEALGNAVLEYMDAGLPVVGTRIGGIPEIVIHAETGWLVPVGDDEALARYLLDLLTDSAQARKMGAAGRDRVRTTFSLEEMVRGYTRIYDSLLATKGLGQPATKE